MVAEEMIVYPEMPAMTNCLAELATTSLTAVTGRIRWMEAPVTTA
jgi:hypothetical protein